MKPLSGTCKWEQEGGGCVVDMGMGGVGMGRQGSGAAQLVKGRCRCLQLHIDAEGGLPPAHLVVRVQAAVVGGVDHLRQGRHTRLHLTSIALASATT